MSFSVNKDEYFFKNISFLDSYTRGLKRDGNKEKKFYGRLFSMDEIFLTLKGISMKEIDKVMILRHETS